MSRCELWRGSPSNATCCGACWMLSPGPIHCSILKRIETKKRDIPALDPPHNQKQYGQAKPKGSSEFVSGRRFAAHLPLVVSLVSSGRGAQWQYNGTGGDMSMALLATNRP